MDEYPVSFAVDYPDRALNRLTTALRILTAILIVIVLGTITGYQASYGGEAAGTVAIGGTGLLFIPPFLRLGAGHRPLPALPAGALVERPEKRTELLGHDLLVGRPGSVCAHL